MRKRLVGDAPYLVRKVLYKLAGGYKYVYEDEVYTAKLRKIFFFFL